MTSKALKSLQLEAGTEKFTKISVYQNGKIMGYLTEEGYITSKIEDAAWFNIKGDAKEEYEALRKFCKVYPFFEVVEAKDKKVDDWDY